MRKHWGLCLLSASIITMTLSGCGDIDSYLAGVYDESDSGIVMQQNEVTVQQTLVSISAENFDADDFGKYDNSFVFIESREMDYEGACVAAGKDGTALFSVNGSDADRGEFGAAFYNTTAAEGIASIIISYKCTEDFVIKYGNDRNNLEYLATIPASSDYDEYELMLAEDASYFRICADKEYIYIENIELLCNGFRQDDTTQQYVDGVRYIPKTDYSPYEGEVLSLPVCDVSLDGSLVVTQWRDYTYHSFDYCYDRIVNYGDDPKEYALTDPVDVAGYFVLFNSIPPNYGVKQSSNGRYYTHMVIGEAPEIDDVQEVFGSELSRCVSQYDYTDGYCESLEYKTFGNTGKPLYYEFDIDIDGTYSARNRGTGRVVGWVGGFEPYDDGINTATVTYNHYYTFGEFSNCGFFNEEFDAESKGLSGRSFFGCETVELE